jgi:polar amino acid transport system substrate-binding protein
MGDLIRARTMEAFFPLVATAVIYFVLCRVLASVLDAIIAKTDPANGPRTIKGVQL